MEVDRTPLSWITLKSARAVTLLLVIPFNLRDEWLKESDCNTIEASATATKNLDMIGILVQWRVTSRVTEW